MVKHINSQESLEHKIAALYAIKIRYKELMVDDAILKHDFNKLMKYNRSSDPLDMHRCKLLLNNLIEDTAESVVDDLDEYPMYDTYDDESIWESDNSMSFSDLNEHLGLKSALEDYQANYMAS